jgi:hypothetical protein
MPQADILSIGWLTDQSNRDRRDESLPNDTSHLITLTKLGLLSLS